ncbi:peptidyl-prolyl cis-trans isomerase [Mitosporidium daphniae]|uniref:Peptidyl-prolyl cis-trans isomerase n=1 Tax=Mitosporidium daphniae TaxID=1485682 RepID=A0A098VN30_9MICR|nr:peptidyl-prolyl cis-trans isomerase [Mitosporidium daphniae]KGG50345.1 peptidyl-prolyl cis-trans isomerase [Mitosporidium daphniae]|eukprot:XP_013236790.1 peptidyl-prolyl cis-trans isomerase [Mitosporidium daphniae]
MSVTLHTTLGPINVELYCKECPKTTENFLALCASSYYNSCIFHRVIKDFIIQTGDPTGSGKGGTSIWGSSFQDEIHENLKHDQPGVISMANSGPNTNKSQFFITLSPQEHLDSKYTVFGKVADKGMDVIRAINDTPVDERYRPVSPVLIENVTVHSNPIADQILNFWIRLE